MAAKVDLFDFLSRQKIMTLCKQINLPNEVVKNVLYHVENDDFTAIKPYFEYMFSPKTGGWAVENIEALCTENGKSINHGYKIMAVFLAAALHTRELYAKAGIDDSIFIQTMSFFNCVVKDYREIYGVCGFDRTFWWWQHLSLNIFRLGTLEFEMRIIAYPEQFGFYNEKSISAIWVHIPSDAVMTREELNYSYITAYTFFNKYYPDFKYRCLCCGAWLLSPVLKDLLPSSSKILEFQSDFAITKVFSDDQSYFIRVFKLNEKPADLNTLPENTTLQCAIKKRLIGGNTIGRAAGVLVNNSIYHTQKK